MMKNIYNSIRFGLNRFSIIPFLASFCILFSACETQQFFESIPENSPIGDPLPLYWKNQIYQVGIQSTPKVDVLFVVDNSGSMADEQAALGASFSGFIQEFNSRQTDTHIGVVSTDMTAAGGYWSRSRANGPYFGIYNNGPGSLLSKYSDEKFLTSQSPNLVEHFINNVNLGTHGSGKEQPLKSVAKALSPELLSPPSPSNGNGWNAGFIRGDALLSVIILTDEDEDPESFAFGETGEQRILDLKVQLNSLKLPEYGGFRVDAAVIFNGPPLYPYVLRLLPTLMGSTLFDINQNFSPQLIELGAQIAQSANSGYTLDFTPYPGTISVTIGGATILEDAANGWVYLPETNKIRINGVALSQLPGQELKIRYASTEE